jgi:transglutaminase-like putative cysteine protease
MLALRQSLSWRLWLVQLALCWLLSPAFSSVSLLSFALLLLLKLLQLRWYWRAWRLTEANLVAAVLVLLFILTSRSQGVLALMVHLLYLAALLRLLGFRTSELNDAKQLMLVHYLLLACALILQQDLVIALVVLLVFLGQLGAHFLAFSSQPVRLQPIVLLKSSLVILPLWALLFVFLPRLPPLWQLPVTSVAQTGLAEVLSPGSISQLVSSDALVFRAEFNGVAPAAAELYWRARIYQHFDGNSWVQADSVGSVDPALALQQAEMLSANQPNPAAAGQRIEYNLLLEPHQQQHLFSLALPVTLPERSRLTTLALLESRRPLSQQTQFALQSWLGPVPELRPRPTSALQADLQLPSGNPTSRQLALDLKRVAGGDAQLLVQQIQQYLQQGGFVYSLTPPVLQGEQIDQFLFASKNGFCSHYAQAAVFLLRAAGVPSRIVGGYLGGEWLANGRYLQVTQKEAHAWVEYYQQGQWHRYDPTLAVAPARAFSRLDELFAADSLAGPVAVFLQQHWQRWLLQPLSELDYFWSRWILGFTPAAQWQLWQQIQHSATGMLAQLEEQLNKVNATWPVTSWQRWLAAFSGCVFSLSHGLMLLCTGLLSASLLFWSWQRYRIWQQRLLLQTAPATVILQYLTPWQPKVRGQTISAYLQQIADQQPALQPQLQLLAQRYQQLSFGTNQSANTASQCLQLLQQIKAQLRRQQLRAK